MKSTFLLGAILLATALPAAAQNRRDRSDEYQSRVDTTIAFDRRGSIVLSANAGEIIVNGWDRAEVRIRARSERSAIRIDVAPSRLGLETERHRGGDTSFELTVPMGVQVSARTTNGDVSIRGTMGPVDVTTQSGDLAVEGASGRIDLRSYSGDITARKLTGTVDVNSLSGDVFLSDVRGDVDATTVSGDVEMRDVVARYVMARSTSGDIGYDGIVDSVGRYELKTHSGNVDITIGEGAGALMTVSTYSGSIESDFPITLKPGDHGIGQSRRFTFEIGKGQSRITAESFSGDITIRSRSGARPER